MRALRSLPVVLTIAGSDSSAGAGIQADIKTFSALGVLGACAITAITAQNSVRVISIAAVKPAMVAAQIEAIAADTKIAALKTGMLANAKIVNAVADAISRLELPAPVVDPITRSTSGAMLLDSAGERAMLRRLFPLARIVTPNIPEAEAMTGVRIRDLDSMRQAAEAIVARGVRAVVVKGGHARLGRDAVDIFFDGKTFSEFRSARTGGREVHGTGCAFSAAIAAYLARGETLEEAVRRAKWFVARAIRAAYSAGRGRAMLNHFAR